MLYYIGFLIDQIQSNLTKSPTIFYSSCNFQSLQHKPFLFMLRKNKVAKNKTKFKIEEFEKFIILEIEF